MLKYLSTQTNTTAFLSKFYPLVATISLLHERRSQRRTATHYRHRRASVQSPQSLGEREAFWSRYWVIYATLQLFKFLGVKIFGQLVTDYFWLSDGLKQVELLFFLGIHGMAHVLPQSQLLQHFTERLASTALFVHNRVSLAISKDTWQNVVEKAKSVSKAMVFMQLLSQPSVDCISHFAQEGRSFLVPIITLFMPGFFTEYGVSYVQYILPLAKWAQPSASKAQSLQYWALHTLTAALLHSLPGFVKWIPFSSHAILILWCWLSLSRTSEMWYNELEEDLQAFGVLPPHPNKKVKQVEDTRIVKVIQWLCERLPHAAGEANKREPAPVIGGQPVEPNADENAANFVELDDVMEDMPDLDEGWVVEEEDEVVARHH